MNAMMLAWEEGGRGMQPLVAVLVLTVYVIVERALWFRRSAFDAEELFDLLKERVRSRDLTGAIRQCTQIRTPVVRVVLAGLLHLGKSAAQVKVAVDLAVLKEAPHAERRVAWLATFAQVAGRQHSLLRWRALLRVWRVANHVIPEERGRVAVGLQPGHALEGHEGLAEVPREITGLVGPEGFEASHHHREQDDECCEPLLSVDHVHHGERLAANDPRFPLA